MNRLNFDKLNSIKTPDEWLENAVNIPDRKKSPLLHFYRHTSFLASAACVALCTIVGIIILFNAAPDKSLPSNNNAVSTIVITDNEGNTIISKVYTDTLQNNSEHNENSTENQRRGGLITQTVTEPTESKNEKATDSSGNFPKATHSSKPDNTSPNSSGGEKQTSPTTGVLATENTEETKTNCSATVPVEEPDTTPPQIDYPTKEPALVYTNSIYFHVDLNSDFDFSNTVGCHIKDSYGNGLYPYNSAYEKCDFVGGSTGWDDMPQEENICFVYNNKGPSKIIYGLYELTFYDINGNTVTRTVNLSDNNSVHIF